MTITYHGHSCFKLKGKLGTITTDPFDSYIGFSPSSLSSDMVTISHDHKDHNAVGAVKGTSRRDKPFVVTHAGEYEVGGISVFGTKTFHDANGGVERGENIVFTILIDGIKICHLGDLGHELTDEQVAAIGAVDILLVPVGGVFTIDPATAVKVTRSLDPNIVIPMHFGTPEHNKEVFSELKTMEDFVKEYGSEVKPEAKLSIEASRLPEETELVTLIKI